MEETKKDGRTEEEVKKDAGYEMRRMFGEFMMQKLDEEIDKVCPHDGKCDGHGEIINEFLHAAIGTISSILVQSSATEEDYNTNALSVIKSLVGILTSSGARKALQVERVIRAGRKAAQVSACENEMKPQKGEGE